MVEDTQLARFEVFLQERPGKPHQDAGSVHAADPEMALYNARDVFVRRPECSSLWVVPAEAIFSRTAQEIEQPGSLDPEGGMDRPPETFYVFCKTQQAGPRTLAGEVQAGSPPEALRLALATFPAGKSPLAWWVVPVSRLLRSEAGDAESLFAPARDKAFRQATDFHTLTAMRRIRAGARRAAAGQAKREA